MAYRDDLEHFWSDPHNAPYGIGVHQTLPGYILAPVIYFDEQYGYFDSRNARLAQAGLTEIAPVRDQQVVTSVFTLYTGDNPTTALLAEISKLSKLEAIDRDSVFQALQQIKDGSFELNIWREIVQLGKDKALE